MTGINDARDKFHTEVVTAPPITTVTDKVGVSSPLGKVIIPTECRVEVQIPLSVSIDSLIVKTAVVTAALIATITNEVKVSSPLLDEVISPTECRGVEVKIPRPTSIDSVITPVSLMSDDSSNFSP